MSKEEQSTTLSHPNRARRTAWVSKRAVAVIVGATIGVGAAGLAFNANHSDNSPRTTGKKPNVEAPSVSKALKNRSFEFAYGYGVGLVVGCDWDAYMDKEGHDDPKSAPFSSLSEFMQMHTDSPSRRDIDAGFSAGIQAGYDSTLSADHEIC